MSSPDIAPQSLPETTAESAPKVTDGIVHIFHEQQTTGWGKWFAAAGLGVGTGYMVSKDGSDCSIVTDSHVVTDKDSLPLLGFINAPLDRTSPGHTYVQLPNQEVVEAEIVENNPTLDRATLKIKTGESDTICQPLTIGSTEQPIIGQEFLAAGFGDSNQLQERPLGLVAETRMGDVKKMLSNEGFDIDDDVKKLNDDMQVLVFKGAAQHGDSGGPAFSASGQVLGRVLAATNRPIGHGFDGQLTIAAPTSMYLALEQ